MKKIILSLFLSLFLLTGCESGEEYDCTINGKKAVFMLNYGIVTSYTLDGVKQSNSIIDEINGIYFTSATNNEEGAKILKDYVNQMNGSCE